MSRRIPLAAAVLTFLVHLFANPHYGFFRDELYFIICGRHPQFGYVDQPPVVPLLAAGTQLFGHSLLLLRAVPALFAAGGVYVTCLLAMEFGGGAFAQILAALAFFFCPVLMNFGMKVSTDMVGLLTWPLLALVAVRLVKGADARLWIAAGALAGISFESKYSVAFLIAAILAGLLLTPQRRILRTPWFAAGCALAVLIALPNVVWQWHYGFPMLELLRNGQNGKNIIPSPLTYLLQEFVITGLFLAVVWIVGLVWLLRTRDYRFLGYAYVALILEMLLFHGKHYYPANVYPIVLAAGAVPIEGWTRRNLLAQSVVAALAVAAGLVLLPFGMPVLSEQAFITYEGVLGRTLHISSQTVATEHGRERGQLPSDWADMHGWPQLAQLVARVYDSLPPADRAIAAIKAANYGQAAAIDFFGAPYHLPPVISGHNQYFLWGPRGYSGDVLIDVDGDCGASAHFFKQSVRAAVFNAPYAEEHDVPVMLCRGIKAPLASIWASQKLYI